MNDEIKGEIPVGFIVLKAGVRWKDTEIVQELVRLVRDRIGPIATF